MRIDTWKIAAVAVVVLGLLSMVGSALYAAKLRGVSETHILAARGDSVARVELEEQNTELRDVANARQDTLDAVVLAAQIRQAADSVALAQMHEEQEEARQRTDSLIAVMEGELTPEMMAVVAPVIVSLRDEIGLLKEEVVEITKERDDALDHFDSAVGTSTTWMTTALGYEKELNLARPELKSLRAAIAAQQAAMSPSFGIRLKLSWWLLPVGFVAGLAVSR